MLPRLLAPLAVALVLLGPAVLPASAPAQGLEARATALRAAVEREEARIARTSAGLASAQRRLGAIEADLRAKQAELRRTGAALVRARTRIERLANRQRRATAALEANLLASYQRPKLDLVTVVVGSRGFSALLDQVEFLKRIARQDAQVLAGARLSKRETQREARTLVRLLDRDRRVAAAIERRREEAQVVQVALQRQKEAQEARRQRRAARLGDVQQELAALRRRERRAAAAAARRAARATGPRPPGVALDRGGMAQPSPGAPEAVRQVIAAGNVIAGLPYQYGGGHGSFQAAAYDCSGSISYALAAAGLVQSPLNSTGFLSWGEAGVGKHITIYTNPGHAFMVVDGWRFDTTALRSGGTRWTREMRSTAGFVARHPPGL